MLEKGVGEAVERIDDLWRYFSAAFRDTAGNIIKRLPVSCKNPEQAAALVKFISSLSDDAGRLISESFEFLSLRDTRNLLNRCGIQTKKLFQALSITPEIHHIIEQRFLAAIKSVNPAIISVDDILGVIVSKELHQMFTLEWMEQIGYVTHNVEKITTNIDVDDLWRAVKKVYADYPKLLDAVRRMLFPGG